MNAIVSIRWPNIIVYIYISRSVSVFSYDKTRNGRNKIVRYTDTVVASCGISDKSQYILYIPKDEDALIIINSVCIRTFTLNCLFHS